MQKDLFESPFQVRAIGRITKTLDGLTTGIRAGSTHAACVVSFAGTRARAAIFRREKFGR